MENGKWNLLEQITEITSLPSVLLVSFGATAHRNDDFSIGLNLGYTKARKKAVEFRTKVRW